MEAKDKKKIIAIKGNQKYEKLIKQRQISKIIKKETLQESYSKWMKEVGDVIKKVKKTVTKKPKERREGATEDKEESPDRQLKDSLETDLNY